MGMMNNKGIFNIKKHSMTFMVVKMREEYDIENLNPRKNPYARRLRKQITMNVNIDTIDYFKELSERCGIPYQTLMNLYLTDCAAKKRVLNLSWE